MSTQSILHRVDAEISTYIEQLAGFVRIPSISAGADQDAAGAIAQAADFLVEEFIRLGLSAEKVQVTAATNPLIVAHSTAFSAARPTVLIYGHYDVQGVDNPRSAWDVDPFAAVIEDGMLIGRGASDNKGPTFAHLKAVDAILSAAGELPVDLVFLIEGEEECGSKAIGQYIASGGLDSFKPIICTVISDTSMYGPDQPSLTLGLRGIVFTEATVYGPRQDVHSGLFGGIIHNPNHLLVQALSALFDEDGRIAVPAFYDDVRPLSEREQTLYRSLPVDEDGYRKTLGVTELIGEPQYSLLERRWTRPTLDVNFLSGGSPRTVIPAQAQAALSCRLVPDQDPGRIEAAIHDHLSAHLPAGTRLEFSGAHHAPPYYLDPDHPLVQPTLNALRSGFDIDPILSREGGSIPIVTDIEKNTGAPVLLVGLGQITDNWHGPNECFSLKDFHRGIRTSVALLHEIGSV